MSSSDDLLDALCDALDDSIEECASPIIDLTTTCDYCDVDNCTGDCLCYSDDELLCASWCANVDCDGHCKPGNYDASPRYEDEYDTQYLPSSPSFCPATPEYNENDEHYWQRPGSPAFYPHDPEIDGPLHVPNVRINDKPACPPAPAKSSNTRPRRYVGRETTLLVDRYANYWTPTNPRRTRK